MPLKSGDIIHTFVQEIYPSKNKYLLCVHPKNKLFLMVSTEDRAIYRCISIKASTYPFLKKRNRFISSNRFFRIQDIDASSTKILASLTTEDRLRIYNKIQDAPQISKAEKELSKILITSKD